MVSAYNTPWVICTKYVLSNYFTTLGLLKETFHHLQQLLSCKFKNWLIENQCRYICMESTSKFWNPVFNLWENSISINITIANP